MLHFEANDQFFAFHSLFWGDSSRSVFKSHRECASHHPVHWENRWERTCLRHPRRCVCEGLTFIYHLLGKRCGTVSVLFWNRLLFLQAMCTLTLGPLATGTANLGKARILQENQVRRPSWLCSFERSQMFLHPVANLLNFIATFNHFFKQIFVATHGAL